MSQTGGFAGHRNGRNSDLDQGIGFSGRSGVRHCAGGVHGSPPRTDQHAKSGDQIVDKHRDHHQGGGEDEDALQHGTELSPLCFGSITKPSLNRSGGRLFTAASGCLNLAQFVRF